MKQLPVLLCLAVLPAVGSEREPVTFAKHIAPVIHSKCTMCHRKGQPGPFELITYKDVKNRAETIQAVVHDKYMPPWKPISHDVEYSNDRRLTDSETKLLDSWIAAGTPSGDLNTVNAPKFSSGWALGKPDLVLKMNGKFAVPASGRDVYRSFVFNAALKEDKWVKAIELRPTARGAVHHALFFIDTSGEARRRDGEDGKPGLSGMSFLRGGNRRGGGRRSSGGSSGIQGLGGYVPGAMPNKLPGDLARLLPKNGDIVMQTHFHPSGKPEWEEAELALYFADEPPSKQMVSIQMPPLFGYFAGIDVPAGKNDFEISQSFTLPVDVEAVQIGGHAHYICREMELHATLPDGKKLDLLTIDDWDLDWQDQYQFKQPIPLPAGTKLDARLVYDNSADNPENPHSPPRRIKWGRESTDEMGSVTLLVVPTQKSDTSKLRQATRDLFASAARKGLSQRAGQRNRSLRSLGATSQWVKSLDRNKDGQLQESEVPERIRKRVFDFADKNNDGVIDENELKKAQTVLRGGR